MPAFIDLTGQRFNMISVLSRAPSKGKHTYWNCNCDCGKKVILRSDSVTRKTFVSCGCHGEKMRAKATSTHRMSKTSEFKIWNGMIQRCHNTKNTNYHRYGGRGIFVIDAWRNSFESFISHIGMRPSKKHGIDRIDNDKGYEPGNVRWATMAEQSVNKSNNHNLTFGNKTLTISQWSEQTGIKEGTIHSRIIYGWSVERTLTEPVQQGATITWNGENHTLLKWSRITGITEDAIRDRIDLGWSADRILTTPIRSAKLVCYKGVSKTIKEWSNETGIKETTIHGRLRTGWSIEKTLKTKRGHRFGKNVMFSTT